MSVLPPSWAMGAVGIGAAGDPHLAPGVHLRVFHAAELGLPIRPFVVYRLTDKEAQRQLAGSFRTDVTWVDAKGRVLTPPFKVTPENPVTGHLVRAPGERAIGVLATTGRRTSRDTPALSHRYVRTSSRRSDALEMRVFIDTPQGRRIIGSRSEEPFGFAAPEIHGIVMSGKGTVREARWIAASTTVVDHMTPMGVLDLPIEHAARYVGLAGAAARADQRVQTGAPQRLGLHDDPSVAGPTAAPPATAAQEVARLKPLQYEITPHLDKLLNDTSQPQRLLGIDQALTAGVTTSAVATAQVASLRAVLAGTADPGMARWLGYMLTDVDPNATSADLLVYYIRGFFGLDDDDDDAFDLGQRLSLEAAGGMLADDVRIPGVDISVPPKTPEGLPVYDWVVPVVVFPTAPPDRPAAPVLGAPVAPADQVGPNGVAPPATADGLGHFLADVVPPDARREVTLPMSELAAAPTLAAARVEGATVVPLNDTHPVSGRALNLVPAIPDGAEETGQGRLTDRDCPDGAVSYKIAQADWFGRWSSFATQAVGAKDRPKPPAPSFDLHYVLAPATPVDDTPRFGSLHVRLKVPRPEDLAPGSRLLQAGHVRAVIGGVTVTTSQSLPASNPAVLDIVVPPPAGMIGRAEQVEAVVDAWWHDGTEAGPEGETQKKTLADPRPPAAITMDPTLRYSARPDAVGRARVVLEWAAVPSRQYRVYTTDETRLKDSLAELAAAGNTTAAGLLTDLAAAPTPAHRAAAYTTAGRAGLYTRDLFVNLTAEPLSVSSASNLRFSHDLSGSLSVLAFYKVVTLSLDNVEGVFTEATLLPVGVPSGGPPPRPLLDLAGFTEAGAARLRVTVVRGPQPAERWRLRRSFAESADPLRMPIVAEGTVPTAPAEGPTIFEIEDAGLDALAGGSLRPWTRTSWRVEVQAPSPPGSTLPGEWSPASGAVSGLRVPPAPVAPTDLSATFLSSDVALAWQHPDPLTRGSMGGYRFDIYKKVPGEREDIEASLLADDPGTVSGTGSSRTFHHVFHYDDEDLPPLGTTWRVVVIDPSGRISPPSSPVTRS